MSFKFLHAADMHLDSPLLGLAGKSADYAQRIHRASREAFEALVAYAIGERCQFVLFAGDVFDGELRNFETGLFFVEQMRVLHEAGIKVFILLGNHDAENRFAGKLAFSQNVHIFASRQAETLVLEELGVAIHGRSFPQRDVLDNIARAYPPPSQGLLNIGVLHTACQGSEGHAAYAPCTVEQLVNHGYDYWALGHVHARAVLHEDPYIIYPGNLQGRHARETGAKGATVVSVEDGRIVDVKALELDVVRWTLLEVDVDNAKSRDGLLQKIRERIVDAAADAGDRALAIRLHLVGFTSQHHQLIVDTPILREEVDILLATLPGDIWLEKLILKTRAPALAENVDPTVAGKLAANIAAPETDTLVTQLIDAAIIEVRSKMPSGAHAEEFFETLRSEMPERARSFAMSLLTDAEAQDAAE